MDHLLHMSQFMLFVMLFGGLLMVIFAVVGAVWIYFDAERLQKEIGQRLFWSLGVLLFFPFFLPLWFFARPSESEIRGYEIMPMESQTSDCWSEESPAFPNHHREIKMESEEFAAQAEGDEERWTLWGCLGYICFFVLLFVFAVYCGAWLASEHRNVDMDTIIRHGQEEISPPSLGAVHD